MEDIDQLGDFDTEDSLTHRDSNYDVRTDAMIEEDQEEE